MDETPIKKTNWKLISITIILVVIQAALVFYGFLLVIFNGLDTYSPELVFQGAIFLLIATALPIPFVRSAKKSGSLSILSLNLFISGATALFLIGLLLSSILGSIQHHKEQKDFQNKTAIYADAAKIQYEKILTETNEVKIIGWMNNNSGTNLLQTDKGFEVHFNDMSYVPEVVDYINKNVIGRTVDVVVPSFVSESTIFFVDSNGGATDSTINSIPVCGCDLNVDGKTLTPILSNMLQQLFKEGKY